MHKILAWIKANKLAALLLLAVGLYLLSNVSLSSFVGYESPSRSSTTSYTGKVAAPEARGIIPPQSDAPPTTDVDERKVIQTSQLSLLVRDVAQGIEQIKSHTESIGGYMVNSNLSRPQTQEATQGTITVRVPATQLDAVLAYYRSLSIKVGSENLQGRDVTDEYVDLEERLKILRSNKARFEEIMAQANDVDEIIRVQTQIFNLQSQIDSLIGQQRYLDQNAQLAKITLTLATDELSLPYTPDTPWRPTVIFKLAVHSLLSNLQNLGSLAIWLGVYSVIWVPIVIVIWWWRKRHRLNE